MLIRALRSDDLPAAAALASAAFGGDLNDAAALARMQARIEHPLKTDPGGCFAAERDGELVALAQVIVRDRLWCLSLLAVSESHRSSGAGGELLRHALCYGADAPAGIIISSADPRAMRLYARAGFTLRPALEAHGEVDRRALPRADPRVLEAGNADLEALAAISRAVRGAEHTAELELMIDGGAQLLRHGDRGFAVSSPEGRPALVAAHDEEAASALLWAALADAREPIWIRWITAGQDWAIQVALAAGLELAPEGPVCVRGNPGPLRPYIPNGAFA